MPDIYIEDILTPFLSTPSARRATTSPLLLRWPLLLFLSTPSARRATCVSALGSEGLFNFYPRPPRGGRRCFRLSSFFFVTFLSTPSARRATQFRRIEHRRKHISIHALREEGDVSCTQGAVSGFGFLSTPSARRATKGQNKSFKSGNISIHALREEGDLPVSRCTSFTTFDFYPRPPRGGRPAHEQPVQRAVRFLSTPSARRATGTMKNLHVPIQISIHALREEGDRIWSRLAESRKRFLSTPSARRATPAVPATRSASSYFYPRPPRGGRPLQGLDLVRLIIFLSTPSARRATFSCVKPEFLRRFLSTPSARRATHAKYEVPSQPVKFLSTPSARRATNYPR